jgi:hypothetical protein
MPKTGEGLMPLRGLESRVVTGSSPVRGVPSLLEEGIAHDPQKVLKDAGVTSKKGAIRWMALTLYFLIYILSFFFLAYFIVNS